MKAELVLNHGPDAVPKARRLVTSALHGCPPSIVDDAELIVAELVTNALLHGAPPVRLRLIADNERIRVELEDTARSAPVRVRRSADAMTGRGLELVDALATDWGVTPSVEGKVVWAEISQREASDVDIDYVTPGSSLVPDIDALLAHWQHDERAASHYLVRLGSVPTELLLAAKGHIDNIVREMTLVRQDDSNRIEQLAPEMAALVMAVTEDFADARTEIKRQALAAASRGDAFTDLTLTMPLTAAEGGERYLAALDEADRYARAARLLTLAPPRSHHVFREWYVRAIIAQVRAAAAGDEAPVTLSFPQVLAAEVDRLAVLEESHLRLELLERVSRDLVGTTTVQEVAEVVVQTATGHGGVEAARLYELGDDDILRSVAWRSDDPAAGMYDEIPLTADLPGAVVARTGEPLFMRSLAQIYEKFPQLIGRYTVERSLHIAPLQVGSETLGLLAFTFSGGELADDAQLSFVRAIADSSAQAMHRAQASERPRRPSDADA